jgi:hypothetical protein
MYTVYCLYGWAFLFLRFSAFSLLEILQLRTVLICADSNQSHTIKASDRVAGDAVGELNAAAAAAVAHHSHGIPWLFDAHVWSYSSVRLYGYRYGTFQFGDVIILNYYYSMLQYTPFQHSL